MNLIKFACELSLYNFIREGIISQSDRGVFMVAFTTTELNVRKNLVISRLAIVRTTVGGAQPPGLTVNINIQ